MPPSTDPSPQDGRCRACGQRLLLTADDCWHPWNVPLSCPPETNVNGIRQVAWGDGFLRPGADMWIPGEPLPHPVLPPLQKPEPLPPSCMAGTCVCPSTPDGADEQHLTGRTFFPDSDPVAEGRRAANDLLRIPVEIDATLPPDTIEIRSGSDSRYIRLDVPEPPPPPLTYLKALERVYHALVDHRLDGGEERPTRIDLHPQSLEDLLIDAPLTESMVVSPAAGDYQPKLRGIPLQGDPRIPLGEIKVVWT